MKQLTFLFVGLMLIFVCSCKDEQETSTYQVNTDIEVDINVVAQIINEIPLKTMFVAENYNFHGTGIFCLNQNPELGKLVCDIQSVNGRPGCMLHFSGITEGNEIKSLFLQWDSKPKNETDFEMQNTVDITSYIQAASNGNIEIELTDVLIPLINCMDSHPDCMYRVDILGTSNFDISTTANLKIPITTENKLYNVRFSLF